MNTEIITNPIDQVIPHPKCSEKYRFISTREVLDKFEDKGWNVVKTDIARARKYQGFQKHIVRLEHPDLPSLGQDKLQLVLKGAHNGQATFEAMFGIFCLVCTNGLMVGYSFESIRIRHIGPSVYSQVETGLQCLIKQVPLITDQVRAMQETFLSNYQRFDFANAALALRWGKDEKGNLQAPISDYKVLEPRRELDIGSNLWTVYNVVQENLVVGGQLGVARTGRRLHTRPIRSIDNSITVNRKLYDLAVSYIGN